MDEIIELREELESLGPQWNLTGKVDRMKKMLDQFGMYAIFENDESESLLESIEEVTECLEQDTPICLELGRIIKPKREPWFHKADKILSEGYWYAKISDIKFGIV